MTLSKHAAQCEITKFYWVFLHKQLRSNDNKQRWYHGPSAITLFSKPMTLDRDKSISTRPPKRPQPAIWKKSNGWKKIRLIFGLAELSCNVKKSAKIWLTTNNFGWAAAEVEPKLEWLPKWVMYLLLLSVSLMLQNLRPSVITRSFEITRKIRFKWHASHLFEWWFHFIIFSADKNSAANFAIGGGLEGSKFDPPGLWNLLVDFVQNRIQELCQRYHPTNN